ncbi:MAG: beta-ketoacyl-ACP synthase III [Acidimicrobiales bacterium]
MTDHPAVAAAVRAPVGRGSILGWGASLPEGRLTNADLEARLDTSDTWIRERTGIGERRIGGPVSRLATEAGALALERAGLSSADVDLLILATSTPDDPRMPTSAAVHRALGLTCGAFDLDAACAGFVYALSAAHAMVQAGHEHVLVIGADAMSTITDPDDRATAILFGDGAAAVVVGGSDDGGLLGWDGGTDGEAARFLYCEREGFIQMTGSEVFRRAVTVVVSSCRAVLDAAGVDASEVALFVPHQANLRIIRAACERLGIPEDHVALVVEGTGNTSAASVPLALSSAADAGRLADGDLVLFTGFGAGMTWASGLARWRAVRA